MKIVFSRSQTETMAAEARRTYPEECCGILTGRRGAESIVVEEVITVDNVWDGPREHRYLLEPRALLRIERQSARRGLEVVGFFHSHPNGQAQPSALDAELAWPDFAYAIVPIAGDRIGTLRGWLLPEDREDHFLELAVHVVPEPP